MGRNAENDDGSAGSGGAAKYPESLVVVVLGGIDVDVELRLGLVKGRQKEPGGGSYAGAEGQRFRQAGGGGMEWSVLLE